MSSEYPLVPLDCPTCGAGIRAEGEDIVFYCTACRNGYRFDEQSRSLLPLEVAFVTLPDREVDLYLPFWLLPARIEIGQRVGTGGSFRGLMRLFTGSEPEETGARTGTFVVPAFQAPLAAITELTRRYTEAFPRLGEKLGERLVGGSYGVADAQKLAHYALIASEVGKPDTLKELRYDLEFGDARLLGVPFVVRGERVEDALFGIAFERAAESTAG